LVLHNLQVIYLIIRIMLQKTYLQYHSNYLYKKLLQFMKYFYLNLISSLKYLNTSLYYFLVLNDFCLAYYLLMNNEFELYLVKLLYKSYKIKLSRNILQFLKLIFKVWAKADACIKSISSLSIIIYCIFCFYWNIWLIKIRLISLLKGKQTILNHINQFQ